MFVKMFMLVSLIGIAGPACSTIKPYEKEYLLHPLMDDQTASRMTPSFAGSQFGNYEKLSASLSGGGGGTSCPTCGG